MRHCGRAYPSPDRTLVPTTPKGKIMFDDNSARHDSQPRFWSLVAITFTPWQMLASLFAERRTYAKLSRLDDYMLKDIGLNRGSIRSAIREGRIRY
jgi:uncharacterized protein YjiS (DUF1127 family)